MSNIDFQIWTLVQNVIIDMLNNNKNSDEILKEISKMTHGMVDWDDIKREINRQRRFFEE